MSLILAIQNSEAIVVACDTDDPTPAPLFGECIVLPTGIVVMLTGNLAAVRTPLTNLLARLHSVTEAGEVARLIHAELMISVTPQLDTFKGRLEIIVAGFDRVHRQPKPQLYYLDSAESFNLVAVKDYCVAGGATAAITALKAASPDFAGASIDQLRVLAKECMSATKLKWPRAIGSHIRIGVIAPDRAKMEMF